MDCPVCKESMGIVEHEGSQLYRCISCSGLLLATDTFKEIQKENDRRLSSLLQSPAKKAVKKRGSRKCPSCKKEMKCTDFDWNSDLEVDVCEKCSMIWLDGGELALIHEHLKEEHPEIIDSELESGSKKIFGWAKKLLATLAKYSPQVG